MWRSKLAGGLAALGLVCATTGSVAFAGGNDNQGQNNNNSQGQNSRPPQLSATPELDSSLLFGVGLFGLGAASAALRRFRKPRTDPRD
jgi:hypothetical protein